MTRLFLLRLSIVWFKTVDTYVNDSLLNDPLPLLHFVK